MLLTKCRDCGQHKDRVRTERKDAAHKSYVYVSQSTGKRWTGRQCPECKYATSGTSWIREDEKEDMVSEDTIELNPFTKRKCRKCSKKLRQSNYFLCPRCLYLSPEVDDSDVVSSNSYHEKTGFKISEMRLLGGDQ